jgi:hypothetical protein
VIPLPEEIIVARADLLMTAIRSSIEVLDRTSSGATLLPEERAHVNQIQRELGEMLAQVSMLRPTAPPLQTTGRARDPSSELVDVRYARNCLDGLVHSRFASRRMLSVALRLVPVIRDVTIDPTQVIGGTVSGRARRTECFLDRVGFVCYTMSRWGSIRQASLASQAAYALGDLRDPQFFVAGLRSRNTAMHALMAAALAIFDDPQSRDALVEYVSTFLEPGSVKNVSFQAVELALIGLAPLPFAGLANELRSHERQVLLGVATAAVDADLVGHPG